MPTRGFTSHHEGPLDRGARPPVAGGGGLFEKQTAFQNAQRSNVSLKGKVLNELSDDVREQKGTVSGSQQRFEKNIPVQRGHFTSKGEEMSTEQRRGLDVLSRIHLPTGSGGRPVGTRTEGRSSGGGGTRAKSKEAREALASGAQSVNTCRSENQRL